MLNISCSRLVRSRLFRFAHSFINPHMRKPILHQYHIFRPFHAVAVFLHHSKCSASNACIECCSDILASTYIGYCSSVGFEFFNSSKSIWITKTACILNVVARNKTPVEKDMIKPPVYILRNQGASSSTPADLSMVVHGHRDTHFKWTTCNVQGTHILQQEA